MRSLDSKGGFAAPVGPIAWLYQGASCTGTAGLFGYGSLIWRPGFDWLEREPARLIGAHRALCVFSHVHRGTPERPGLVLGLDLGGACRGVAYRVTARQRPETIAYLR